MGRDSFFLIRFQEQIPKLEGPLSKDAVCQRLETGELSWADWIIRKQEPARLLRIYELLEFHLLLPALPSKAVLEGFVARIAGENSQTKSTFPEDEQWWLQVNGSEFGPLTHSNLAAQFTNQKRPGDAFVWHPGMENWAFVSTPEELIHIAKDYYTRLAGKDPTLEIETGRNQRGSPRAQLIATVAHVAPQGRTFLGTCKNLSATGLLLRHKKHGAMPIGQKMLIEILPVSVSGLKPFRAEASVRWSQEKRSGLRFEKLSPESQRALDEHLVSKFWGPQA